MMRSRLSYLSAALLCLPLLTISPLAVRADPPAAPVKSAFSVEETPFTSDDLAEVLGYKHFGWRCHFTQPVYVRMKIWDLAQDVDPEEDADEKVPPTSISPLSEATNNVAITILRRDRKEDDDGHRLDLEVVDYKILLRGENAEDPSSERSRAEREVKEAFSNIMTRDERTLGRAFCQASLRQEFRTDDRFVLPQGQEGPDIPLPNPQFVKKLAEGLSTPEGRQRLAEEKAKWQAFAEERMLAKPVTVYRKFTQTMLMGGNDRQVRGRALVSVVLEFSRTPFTDNDTPSPQRDKPAAPKATGQ